MEEPSGDMAAELRTQQPRQLESDWMWRQLANTINIRTGQDQVLWRIFSTFWAANALLFGALFVTTNRSPVPGLGILVSGMSLLLSLSWFAIQLRALGNFKRFDELIRKIEEGLEIPVAFALSPEINKEDYKKFLRGPRARHFIPWVCTGWVALWAVLLEYFLIVFFR